MYNPPTQYGRRQNITYPRGRLLHYLVLGLKFSGFHDTKTSVNKRLLCHAMSRFEVLRAGLSRPHCPSVNHYGCKIT